MNDFGFDRNTRDVIVQNIHVIESKLKQLMRSQWLVQELVGWIGWEEKVCSFRESIKLQEVEFVK